MRNPSVWCGRNPLNQWSQRPRCVRWLVRAECLPPPDAVGVPQECCGNGCQTCVYITYWEEKQQYEDDMALYIEHSEA